MHFILYGGELCITVHHHISDLVTMQYLNCIKFISNNPAVLFTRCQVQKIFSQYSTTYSVLEVVSYSRSYSSSNYHIQQLMQHAGWCFQVNNILPFVYSQQAKGKEREMMSILDAKEKEFEICKVSDPVLG